MRGRTMSFPSLRLDGKLAIVTGGGGTLGGVAAMAFAEAGADVVVVARTLAKCETVAQKVRDLGRRSLALSVDVLAQDQLDGMVARIMGEWGKIDILFNNAGTSSPHSMLESGVEEWCRVIDVNIKGTFLCTRAVAPVMIAQGAGRIINMGSITVKAGVANRTAYATSKAGVAAFTKALAFELGPSGITVNALCPTSIETDMNRELRTQQASLYEGLIRRTPLGRLGRPEDLAGALVFLASPAAAFITGQSLFVDGGFTAG